MPSHRNRSHTTQGIILMRKPWKESSFILDVLTVDFGRITVLAQGVRRQKKAMEGMFESLNEAEWVLHKSPESEWFILKDITMVTPHLYDVNLPTSALMQAAAELLLKLLYDDIEAVQLYQLLKEYLAYVVKVQRNGIAVLWRFMLRISLIFGFPLFLNRCVKCSKPPQAFGAYYPQLNGLICTSCLHPAHRDVVIPLTPTASDLFIKLPHIGSMLDDITISIPDGRLITDVLLLHLSQHFNRAITLKSLELYFLAP